MRNSISAIVAIGVACAALLVSLLRKPERIGIVDNAMLMSQFTEAVAANRKLQEMEEAWKTNLKTLQDSVQAAVDALSKGYGQAKENDRLRMGESLNRWNSEYSRYQAAVEKMRVEKQKEVLNPVLEKVNAFVKTWALENGFAVILGTGNGGVVLAVAEAQNVTARILKDLNHLYIGSSTGKEDPSTGNSGKVPEREPSKSPDTSSSLDSASNTP